MAPATRRDRNAGRLVRLVVACVALTTTACESKTKGVVDTAKGAGSGQSPTDTGVNTASPPPQSLGSYNPFGTLPRPLDDMLKRPAELKQLVDPGTKYTGQSSDTDCKGCPKGTRTKVH